MGVQISPWEGVILRGRDIPLHGCVLYRNVHSAVSVQKTAEPIEMPFGTLSRVDTRNHVLDGGTDPPWEGEF